MAKTLVEFRAEKGLYLKDVAEAINVPEEELSKIEALNGTPEYIAEKLIVAYNLPENYFSGEKSEQPIKPIKNLKSYFFKTSLIWYFVLGLVLAIPMSIVTSITPIMAVFLEGSIADIVGNVLGFVVDVVTVVVTIMYCKMFANNIMKKTGLKGDIYKYRYLYDVIPAGAVAVVSIFSGLVVTVFFNEAMADESRMNMVWVGYGINLVISLISMILVALVMASLLNTAVMDDEAAKAKRHKTMAMIVTISSVLAFALTIFANTLEEVPRYDTIVRRLFVYGVYIATAWLVALAKEKDTSKEKLAFTILPLISIVDGAVSGFLGLFGI